jgi:hypothetical protein
MMAGACHPKLYKEAATWKITVLSHVGVGIGTLHLNGRSWAAYHLSNNRKPKTGELFQASLGKNETLSPK